MEKSNNKKRILALVEILRKQSDGNNHLKLDEIIKLLKEKGIETSNRKTLYDDFKILNEYGINVEYDNGYYLLDAPFNLSEIKIIIDSLNSLKSLDNRFLNDLNNKLYSFISLNDEKLIDSLSFKTKHSDSKLLQHMEDILESIRLKKSLFVKVNKGGEYKEIFPLFLHRSNDYYYVYYHYEESNKIYHYRFDSIKDIKLGEKIDSINITNSKIISHINESVNAFSKGNSHTLTILFDTKNEKLASYLFDDFPGGIRTKEGYSIKADINNNFYSKIVKYGKEIKIKEKDIAKGYRQYLESIIKSYQG